MREELRSFYRQAKPLLDFPVFWIDDAKSQAIGKAFGEVIARQNYTVWACAILSNHAHLVIRRHRDDALRMWHVFADATGDSASRVLPCGSGPSGLVIATVQGFLAYAGRSRQPDRIRYSQSREGGSIPAGF